MNLAFPFRPGRDGAPARCDDAQHVRDMIEQVLFTAPGERVNRPDFGCGLGALLFDLNGSEVAAVTQALVQGALQQWLGDLVQVEAVQASADGGKLTIRIQYILLATRQRQLAQFVR